MSFFICFHENVLLDNLHNSNSPSFLTVLVLFKKVKYIRCKNKNWKYRKHGNVFPTTRDNSFYIFVDFLLIFSFFKTTFF